MKTIKILVSVLFHIINKFQTAIATFAMAGLAILVCVQVFLRYVLNAPLFGIEEVQEFFAIWVYFFGGTMASFQKSHIQCGIIRVYFNNKRFIYAMDIVKDFVSLAITVFLAYSIWGYVEYVTMVWKRSSIWLIPTVLGECSIFVAVIIMGIFAVRDIIETIIAGPDGDVTHSAKELEEIQLERGCNQ